MTTELLAARGLTKHFPVLGGPLGISRVGTCLLYTSDAADD